MEGLCVWNGWGGYRLAFKRARVDESVAELDPSWTG